MSTRQDILKRLVSKRNFFVFIIALVLLSQAGVYALFEEEKTKQEFEGKNKDSVTK
ncbi:MAG: hypothetical protein AABY26_03400 [Nanoarchaeota archaeon]